MDVKIRPLRIEDAYTSVKWRNDNDVFKYTGNIYDHEITIESELEWIKRVIAKEDDYRCAIHADDVYIGNIYLTDISENSATYHIFIGNKDYWGKGVARKASELILHYAFKILGLETINLEVHKDNKAALSLYHKLGFQENASDSKFICMQLTNRDIQSQNTVIYDVTIKNVDGDGSYFDFTFESENSEEFSYRLYPFYNGPYPQKELVYININLKDGFRDDKNEVVKFNAPMPEGYVMASVIARESKWTGLKGELSISKERWSPN